MGGQTGDLYIFVAVAPHRMFQRDAADLHLRVPIPMATAALGGSVEVPTIEGKRAKVTVPKGTQSGHQFRLRGKGMSLWVSPHSQPNQADYRLTDPAEVRQFLQHLIAIGPTATG